MLFVPMLPLPAVYASASFPMYIANYAEIGAGLRWLAAATSMFFCVAIVVCTAALIDRLRAARVGVAGGAVPPAAVPSTAAA